MSDELTMRQKGIRGLIAALDVEAPIPQVLELFKKHPRGILSNDDGVPVMPIYRIVEVVLAAVLPEGDLDVAVQAADQTQQAIDTLARAACWYAFADWTEDAWEKYYPEIGQYDYDRIVACMKTLLPADPTTAEFAEAYEFIADRAEKTP